MADIAPMFASATAVRAANRPLLDRLDELAADALPDDFLADIEAFRERAAAAGAILSSLEERSETQTAINFWTTILFGAAVRPAPSVLAPFDREAARARLGDAAPYKGLEAFQLEDSDKFFGRNKAVSEMLDKLSHHRLLAVLGLSGSGKSSVVRAGLLPRLAQGAVPGSEDWAILAPIVPGRSPVQALTEMVGRCIPGGTFGDPASFVAALDATGRRVLILIDQFEELFTLEPPEDERRAFLDMLVAAATTGIRDHAIILTMRSEFDSRLRRYEIFDQLFEAGRVQVSALSPAELRSAIQEPAEQAGLSFESGLPEELVQAVVGEPAGLPLLQFTLLELWKRRSGDNRLTWEAYKALGGNPREILARRADQVWCDFALKEDRDISQAIFLALIRLGSGLEPMSRRVLRSDLDAAVGRGRDNVDRVLGKWRDNGLVRISPPGEIVPDSQVEVAHEALIRNWDLLGEWIQDAFATTRRRRLLTEKALAWQQGKGELLGELSLNEAEAYESFSDDEREYLSASRVGVEQARRRIRRRNQVALAGSLAMAVLTVTAAATSIWALRSQIDAARQAGAASKFATDARAAFDKAAAARQDLLDSQRAAENSQKAAAVRILEANRLLAEANGKLGEAQNRRESIERALARARAHQAEVSAATTDKEKHLADLQADLGRLDAERVLLDAKVKSLQTQVELAQVRALEALIVKDQAEGQAEAARNVSQQILAALARHDVTVTTAVLQQPAGISKVRERLPIDLPRRRERGPFGLPDAPLVFDRRFYTVGFDPAILSPRWVAFTVHTRDTLQLRRRLDEWTFDPAIPQDWQTGNEAYRNNSYDRGQLVRRQDALVGPSEADARASEAEVYYYSVTVPQADMTNRVTWTAVEQYTTELSARLGPIHVVAGPVYPDLKVSNGTYLTLGPSRTTVPLYLYRVLLRRDAGGRWRSLAFLVPNDASTSRNARQFATSVGEIERLTGLRFFSALPASEEAALKSNMSPADFESSDAGP